MQDRPTAVELLDAIAEYLEEEVLPAAADPVRYHTRVALNLVGMLAREWTLGPAADAAERARLTELLGPAPDATADLAELNRRLAERLTADADPAFQRRAWAALHAGALDKLAVARPGYERYDSATESPARWSTHART
ncbi:MAG: DUF6285 domain-containing protein [Acidimicrobiales bacterium]